MKNFLTIILVGIAAVLLIGLIVTGIKYQQAVSIVEQQKAEIKQLQKKNEQKVIDHFDWSNSKMKEAGR